MGGGVLIPVFDFAVHAVVDGVAEALEPADGEVGVACWVGGGVLWARVWRRRRVRARMRRGLFIRYDKE